jgi:hypothetical protein
VALADDTASTVTRDGGFWHVELPALEAGDAIVDVNVRSESNPDGYWVRGIHLTTVSRGGEGRVVERWVTAPYFAVAAELFLRSFATKPRVANTRVAFRRTGGVELQDSVFQGVTDASGRVVLFGGANLPETIGEVVGELTVFMGDPWGTMVLPNIRIGPPTHVFRASPSVILLGVGPSLAYYGYVSNRATGKLMPGVQIDVRRLGGIPLRISNLSMVSSPQGAVIFNLEPEGPGVVNVEITVRAPPPGTPVVMNASLATFNADTARHLTNWNLEPSLPYFGVVRASFGRPFVDAPVEIRRTGGIAVQPDSFTTRTNGDGVFSVQPVPLAIGDAIFDMIVRLPPPYNGFIVRNVRLSATEQDFPFGRPFWVWDLDVRLDAPPGATVTPLSP